MSVRGTMNKTRSLLSFCKTVDVFHTSLKDTEKVLVATAFLGLFEHHCFEGCCTFLASVDLSTKFKQLIRPLFTWNTCDWTLSFMTSV